MNINPAVMLDLIRKEKTRRECERSLMSFTRHAWSIIEPAQEFKENWHLEAIAEHLEAVSRGDINMLIISVPPGCMKSILVSVAFPAWEWIKEPGLRYLGASYGIDLAIRDAQKCRDVITSDWYRSYWGERVQIRTGDDNKLKYSLTSGGWRMATSVGGRATGEHPDRKIIDDPHNAKQAESDAERESALTWFDRTLSTRGMSRGARTILVAQRFNEQDLTGHILAEKFSGDHLCIPMEYDGNRRVTSLGWTDPRQNKGELLWPAMFNEAQVSDLKQRLGVYGASGQLQQEPAPPDGGILNTQYFQLWSPSNGLPQFEYVLQSYDCAFTDKTSNDPTACTVWAVFTHKGQRNVMLIDAWDEHLTYPELRARAIMDWATEYGGGDKRSPHHRARRPDRVLVEEKAAGISLIQDLRLARVPVVTYNPGGSDKIARAHQAAPTLELGIIWVPESGKNPGHPVGWASGFMKQLSKFPRTPHDDYVDTFTQAIIYLKDNQWFELPKAKYAEDMNPRAQEPRINPYAI